MWTSLEASSLVPSIQNGRVGIDAAIPQERPISAYFLDAFKIAFDHQNFFLIGGGFRENLAERIANKRMSPEFESAFGRTFKADTIHSGDKNPVGDGM
jgi:hypothetical protein